MTLCTSCSSETPAAQPLAVPGEELDAGWRYELLQRLASREPPAASKSLFPRYAEGLSVGDLLWHKDVRQVYVALGRALVPAEYGVDGCTELIAGRLVDAACIYPEILEALYCSSFATEADFGVGSLILACIGPQLIVCGFFTVGPCA